MMTEGFAGVYHNQDGLPDPQLDAQFYDGVVTRRLVAWFFDVILIGVMTIILSLLTLGLMFLVFPLAFTVLSVLYRWTSIARHSATPGMRLVGIELRDREGNRFASGTALAHTAMFMICSTVIVGQLISIVLMLMTPRKQGLPDLLLGTAAINRPI